MDSPCERLDVLQIRARPHDGLVRFDARSGQSATIMQGRPEKRALTASLRAPIILKTCPR